MMFLSIKWSFKTQNLPFLCTFPCDKGVAGALSAGGRQHLAGHCSRARALLYMVWKTINDEATDDDGRCGWMEDVATRGIAEESDKL